MTRRIGIYSGTFDPIHSGHIAFALAALAACQLDKVVFIPETNPRNKAGVTDIRHRIAMVERAVKPHEKLAVAALSTARFTIADTLPELRQRFPGVEVSLLIGSDIARNLARWEGLEQLAGSRFIIGLRREDTLKDIAASVGQAVSPYGIPFTIIPQDTTGHISSSTARNGDTSSLPAEILPYIQQNNLYR